MLNFCHQFQIKNVQGIKFNLVQKLTKTFKFVYKQFNVVVVVINF